MPGPIVFIALDLDQNIVNSATEGFIDYNGGLELWLNFCGLCIKLGKLLGITVRFGIISSKFVLNDEILRDVVKNFSHVLVGADGKEAVLNQDGKDLYFAHHGDLITAVVIEKERVKTLELKEGDGLYDRANGSPIYLTRRQTHLTSPQQFSGSSIAKSLITKFGITPPKSNVYDCKHNKELKTIDYINPKDSKFRLQFLDQKAETKKEQGKSDKIIVYVSKGTCLQKIQKDFGILNSKDAFLIDDNEDFISDAKKMGFSTFSTEYLAQHQVDSPEEREFRARLARKYLINFTYGLVLHLANMKRRVETKTENSSSQNNTTAPNSQPLSTEFGILCTSIEAILDPESETDSDQLSSDEKKDAKSESKQTTSSTTTSSPGSTSSTSSSLTTITTSSSSSTSLSTLVLASASGTSPVHVSSQLGSNGSNTNSNSTTSSATTLTTGTESAKTQQESPAP